MQTLAYFSWKKSVTKVIIPKAVHKNYGAEWAEKSCLHASFYPDISQ